MVRSARVEAVAGTIMEQGRADSLPAGPLRALIERYERQETREGLARQLEAGYPLTHRWARHEDGWSQFLSRLPEYELVSLTKADQVCCALGGGCRAGGGTVEFRVRFW